MIDENFIKNIRVNDKNPRQIKDERFDKLCESIQQFPKMLELRPIIVDKDGVILGGNMRFKALKKLKMELKPEWIKVADELTEDERKRFIIEDNVAFGDWDIELLKAEWQIEQLKEWGVEMEDWTEEEKAALADDYSQKLGEIIYEPKQTDHKPEDLYKIEHKFDEDIKKIKNEKLREMFQARAFNFTVFDFPKIADYYAYQATPEEQRVFEKLAMVLLDRDKLIENGFSKLITDIDVSEEEYEN